MPYAVCYKCNQVIPYAVCEETHETTFPRGEWLVHRDHIVSDIKTREEAEKLLELRELARDE